MEKYKKYENFRQEFVEARSWISNKDKIDSQTGNKYGLHNISFSADYCGQAYAGANNYHHSPKIFNEYVAKVIKQKYNQIFSEALELMKSDLDEKLVLCKEEIATVQKNIQDAEESLTRPAGRTI